MRRAGHGWVIGWRDGADAAMYVLKWFDACFAIVRKATCSTLDLDDRKRCVLKELDGFGDPTFEVGLDCMLEICLIILLIFNLFLVQRFSAFIICYHAVCGWREESPLYGRPPLC